MSLTTILYIISVVCAVLALIWCYRVYRYFDKLTKERDDAINEATTIKNNFDNTYRTLEFYEKAYGDMRKEYDPLVEENRTLSAEVRDLRSERDALRDKADTLTASLCDAETDLAALRDQLIELRSKLADPLPPASLPEVRDRLAEQIADLLVAFYESAEYRTRQANAADCASQILDLIATSHHDATPKDPATTPADAPCTD